MGNRLLGGIGRLHRSRRLPIRRLAHGCWERCIHLRPRWPDAICNPTDDHSDWTRWNGSSSNDWIPSPVDWRRQSYRILDDDVRRNRPTHLPHSA